MEELKVGQRVTVSNGQPKPPNHHRKKLEAWQYRNYGGVIKEVSSSHVNIETSRSDTFVFTTIWAFPLPDGMTITPST